jgi:hypothetical protein
LVRGKVGGFGASVRTEPSGAVIPVISGKLRKHGDEAAITITIGVNDNGY